MPFYRVIKGHECYSEYETVVEATDAESANHHAGSRDMRNGPHWHSIGYSDDFDHVDILEDRTEEVGDDYDPSLKTFTVFCQEASGRGTIWIGGVEAKDSGAAADQGAGQCAEDWGDDYELDDIHVLGVAEGNVNILEWSDLDG